MDDAEGCWKTQSRESACSAHCVRVPLDSTGGRDGGRPEADQGYRQQTLPHVHPVSLVFARTARWLTFPAIGDVMPKDVKETREKKTFSRGTYADGQPLDEVTYLEAKLILKPDQFTSVQSFRDFGKIVK